MTTFLPSLFSRRTFIFNMLAGAAGLACLRALPALAATLNLTKEQWKQKLTPEQFDILREEGTERPFTSALNNEHRAGIFACVGCAQPLFSSKTKFDSGTGWPSFYEALPGAIETTVDYKLLMPRTEYHCSRCGGHHGHIFNDGPQPTGLRHCSNGAVLTFTPAA